MKYILYALLFAISNTSSYGSDKEEKNIEKDGKKTFAQFDTPGKDLLLEAEKAKYLRTSRMQHNLGSSPGPPLEKFSAKSTGSEEAQNSTQK